MSQDWMEAALAAASTQPMPMTCIPDPVPGRLLSLDGDYLAYFMAGNQDTEPGAARRNAMARIVLMKEMTGSTGCVMHLSANGGTKADRRLISTVQPYQENRAKGASSKPKNWGTLRDLFESYQGSVFAPKIWWDREADDGMAYMQQKYLSEGKPNLCITATRDKDMRQYSGWHMDWTTYMMTWVPEGAFEVMGENGLLYGHKWFWQQCLQGDTADHIPGLPRYAPGPGKLAKVGEKTAETLLANVHSDSAAFSTILFWYETYYEKVAGIIRLAEQMLLLWLRRDKEASWDDMLKWLLLDYDQQERLRAALYFHRDRVHQMKAEVAAIEAKNFSTQSCA